MTTPHRHDPAPTSSATDAFAGRGLVAALMFIALVVAAIGSLGAPLIAAVAETYHVSLDVAQWTLTITLLVGAVATPLLGRIGSSHRRRVTVLTTLVIVVAGSVATVVPAGIGMLMVGRAAQGAGLALTALMMATARDALGPQTPRTIALLSVASTAGIGVGYPVAGLLAEHGGVRAAYGLGLAVTAAALTVAIRTLPRDVRPRAHQPSRPGTAQVDWAGALLLSAALTAVLLVTSITSWWTTRPAEPAIILAVGVLLLAAWVGVERRHSHPLVDLAALRHASVAGANLVMGIGGVAMYLVSARSDEHPLGAATAAFGRRSGRPRS